MALFDKDIYNPEIPVCEKHNFRGTLCLQCLHERTVSREDVENLLKLLMKLEIEYTAAAKVYLIKNNDKQFHLFMGQRKTVIKIQKHLKKILAKYSII